MKTFQTGFRKKISAPLAITAIYYASFTGLGMVAAALGPSLPGLAEQTHVQLKQASLLFTAINDHIQLPIAFRHYPHTIRVTSHSKDLSLPGERIGYVAVSPLCEDLEEMIAAIIFANRTLGFVNAPALMQRLVAPLQRNSVNVREYEEKRDLFYNSLISFGYEVVKPQGAFYLFPKAPIENDVTFVKELQSKRILTVPGTDLENRVISELPTPSTRK